MNTQTLKMIQLLMVVAAGALISYGVLTEGERDLFVQHGTEAVGGAIGLVSLFMQKRLAQHERAVAAQLPAGVSDTEIESALDAQFIRAGFFGSVKRALKKPRTYAPILRELPGGEIASAVIDAAGDADDARAGTEDGDRVADLEARLSLLERIVERLIGSPGGKEDESCTRV